MSMAASAGVPRVRSINPRRANSGGGDADGDAGGGYAIPMTRRTMASTTTTSSDHPTTNNNNTNSRRWIPLQTQGRTQSLQSHKAISTGTGCDDSCQHDGADTGRTGRNAGVASCTGASTSRPNLNDAAFKRNQVGWEQPPQQKRMTATAPMMPTTSILTTLLIKLSEVLPEFSKAYQQEPTFDNIKAACECINDVGIDFETSIPWDRNAHGSPSSPKSSMSTHAVSPRSSPLSPSIPSSSWFVGSSSSSSSSYHYHHRNNISSNTGVFSQYPPTYSGSASAIRREWDTLVAQPLIMFACLEALYVDLSHACGVGVANNMARLYERTKHDLKILRKELCDPYIPLGVDKTTDHLGIDGNDAESHRNAPHAPPDKRPLPEIPPLVQSESSRNVHAPAVATDATPSSNSQIRAMNSMSVPSSSPPFISSTSYRQMAVELASTLDALMAICTARCGLISLQMGLWNWDNNEVFEFGEAALLSRGVVVTLEAVMVCSSKLLPSLNISNSNQNQQRIIDDVLKEAKAWLYMMELTDSLMTRRYPSSIILAQKVKTRLARPSAPTSPLTTMTTNMNAWMTKLLRSMIGLFPIIFDRIDNSTDRFYGFQKSNFGSLPPGTRLESSEDLVETVEDFLRLEEKTGGPPIAIAILFDVAGTCNRNLDKGFSLAPTTAVIDVSRQKNQQSGVHMPIRTPSIDAFPPIFLRTSRHEGAEAYRNMSLQTKESAGNQRSTSTARTHDKVSSSSMMTSHEEVTAIWPFSCWEEVVAALPTDFTKINSSTCSSSSRVGGSRASHPSSDFQQWFQADDETLIQSARVNPFMWLVFLTKSIKSDSRWNTRRQRQIDRTTEEEVWPFFNGLLGLLRSRCWFNSKRAVETRRKGPEPFTNLLGDEFMQDRVEWNEHDLLRLFISIRETFSLRSRHHGGVMKKSPLQTTALTLSMMVGGRADGGTTSTAGSSSKMSQKQRLLSYKSPALRKILPGFPSRSKSKAPSHQFSANAFFLGEDLAHAIETDDDHYNGDDDDDW